MTVGDKIKKLRKESNMTQGQLSIKIGTDAKLISKYENNINLPTTETLIKIAEYFNVSLDYLVKSESNSMATTPIRDKDLLRQFEELDRMSDEEKAHIKYVIQSVLDKNRFKNLAKEAV